MLMSEINETLERLRKSALSLNNIFVPEDLTERLGPRKFFSLLAIVKQTRTPSETGVHSFDFMYNL